jgi:hypothetical protein
VHHHVPGWRVRDGFVRLVHGVDPIPTGATNLGAQVVDIRLEWQDQRLTVPAVRHLRRTLRLHLPHTPARRVGRHVERITVQVERQLAHDSILHIDFWR